MATSNIVPSEEKADCLRLLSLVIDGGREVLFHQFDQRLPCADLNFSNKLNEPDIRKKLEKVLNKDQKNRVYRQLGQPDSSKFDVTLLTPLLRYACDLDENSSVWSSKPSPKDESVVADIVRLKTIRNKMSHMNNLTLSKTEFETYWDNAEKVIIRLGHDIPGLKERINKLKHENIDPSKEREYQAKLKEYKEMEQSLKQDVEEVKDSLANVDKRLEIVESEVQSYDQLSAEVETQGERLENLQIEQEKHGDKLAELDKQRRNQAEQLEDIVSKHAKQDSGDVACLISRTRLHVDEHERQNVFVATNAYRQAKNILENNGWVILTGQPGEGKTTIALELLREMQPTRVCVKLNDPQDWKIIDLDRDKVDVIFVDDIFGGGAFNDGLFAEWSKLLPDISKAIQNKKMNAIITTRHYILEEARERMHRKHGKNVFKDENTVYIASYDLTEVEKTQMLEVHFRYAEREITPGLITDCVCEFDRSFRELPTYYNLKNHFSNHGDLSDYMRNGSMIGFPEIVSLFAQNDHLFNVGSMFFFEPLIFFKKCMEDLYLDKEKFLALLLVWTRQNQVLKLLDLEPPDVSDELKETAEKFGLKLEDPILTKLRNSLEYHKEGFLLFDSEIGIYKFSHNIVKDMVGLVGGKKHPAAVLEYASFEFLMRYVSVQRHKSKDGLHIFIEPFRYKQLVKFVWNVLRSPEKEVQFGTGEFQVLEEYVFFGVSLVLSERSLQNLSILIHDCFENDSFVREFIQHDYENVLLSHSICAFQNIFGNYGISLQENIPVYLPSLALLYEKPALLCLCLESDKEQERKDEHFLHTNTLLAIHKQSFRALESLFRHGAVANDDAIYLAARKGNATILKFLLERKQTSNRSKSNVLNGNSPLIAAAKTTSTECVITLLNDGGVVNYKNDKGWTALDKGILYGRSEVCKLLLEHGALVNKKSGKFKRTPLHRSAEFGNKELTKVLLQYKASVYVRDSKGLLPIHCAAFSGNHDIVDMLLKAQPESKQLKYRISYGKKSVLSGADLFHIAVWKNKHEVIKVLMLNKVNPNIRDFYGRTPFYRAAYEGKMDSIKEFISYFDQNHADNKTVPSIDINIAENHGFTPLHAAIHMGHTEIAKLICPYASVNAQDKLGKTPLHTACEKLNLEMFELLIKVHHADFRTVTKTGQSIFDILENKCKRRNVYKIVRSLDKLWNLYLKEPRWVDFLTVVKEVDEEFAKPWENVKHKK